MVDKMYGLKQFMRFDWNAFSEDKEFTVTDFVNWDDFNTHQHLGTKVTVVITKDKTVYKQYKGNEKSSNMYKRLDFKVSKDDLDVSIGDRVRPVNPKIYAYGRDGDGKLTNQYLNYLSVQCDDIEIIATD